MSPALVQQFIDWAYIVATVFFVLSIKWLS